MKSGNWDKIRDSIKEVSDTYFNAYCTLLRPYDELVGYNGENGTDHTVTIENVKFDGADMKFTISTIYLDGEPLDFGDESEIEEVFEAFKSKLEEMEASVSPSFMRI